MNVTTIDITETITALHQCTTLRDRNAKEIAQENRDYNRILIGKLTGANPDGYTDRMILKTIYDWQGDVFVVARKSKTKKLFSFPYGVSVDMNSFQLLTPKDY